MEEPRGKALAHLPASVRLSALGCCVACLTLNISLWLAKAMGVLCVCWSQWQLHKLPCGSMNVNTRDMHCKPPLARALLLASIKSSRLRVLGARDFSYA